MLDLPALYALAADIDPGDVAAVARLRREYSADLVAAALALATARRKAATKFPGRADTLIADPPGVEQASSVHVAAHKARRYLDLLGPDGMVVDLCSGIGGDTMAMSNAGLQVLAIDRDPLRAWMTSRNANCPAGCADVRHLRLRGTVLHLDPARRSGRGRIFRLADYQPGPEVIRGLLRDSPDGGIKLSPGIDLAELKQHGLQGELEFISEGGRLVQAMLWTGRLRRGDQSATLIDPRNPETAIELPGKPEPTNLPIGPMKRYLFTVDPAVERADLMAVLCEQLQVHAVHPRLGLLTADGLLDSPWLTPFELLEELPWRGRDPRQVKQWLAAHEAGIVEVKTRGKAVDPDHAQAVLRGKGAAVFTVFVLRWDQRLRALITRRVGPDSAQMGAEGARQRG